MTSPDYPPMSARNELHEEGIGAAVFIAGLAVFAVLAGTAMTGTIDDLAVWVFGAEFLRQVAIWVAVGAAGAVVVAGMRWSSDIGAHRIGSAAHHADGQAEAAIHEGHGHAAVAHGVGVRVRSAEANPDGGGVTRLNPGDWKRATPAEKLAICRSGEVAAGPVGCKSDRRNYASELRSIPRRERSAAEAEAARLCAQHVGSSFGQRVARALERNGRWH